MIRFLTASLVSAVLASAAGPCTISTAIGGAVPELNGDGGPAARVRILFESIAVGRDSRIYLGANGAIRTITDGVLDTLAGTGKPGYGGDGHPAKKALVGRVLGIALDGDGNVYFSDTSNYRIRKIDATGIITTIAGNGESGPVREGGRATQSPLRSPYGIAVDSRGEVYFSDNTRVFRIGADGLLTTYAGGALVIGDPGDGGPAIQATLRFPEGLAFDSSGALFIAENGGNRVRRVSPDGIITTVAGTGSAGAGGDGASATSTRISVPSGVALDGVGNLYIVEGDRIRRVGPDGIMHTIFTGADRFSRPLAADESGHVYFHTEELGGVRWSPGGATTSITLRQDGRSVASDIAAHYAILDFPQGLAVSPEGRVFVADGGSSRVRVLDLDGRVRLFAGSGRSGDDRRDLGNGGPAEDALMDFPRDVVQDGRGNVLIADEGVGVVWRVRPDGSVEYFAGGHGLTDIVDGVPATGSALRNPVGLGVDAAGNLYIADRGDNRIRKVGNDGIISTVAGGGVGGDGSPATEAALDDPRDVAVDAYGNMYIAENHVVRRVGTDGVIETIAGQGEAQPGDGGRAVEARLISPVHLEADAAGNVYVADGGDGRVRIIRTDGTIDTVAGGGPPGYSPDGTPATEAGIHNLSDVSLGGNGDLYYIDMPTGKRPLVRKVNSGQACGGGAAPEFNAAGVVSAASFDGGGVSPGQLVTIFGRNLGPVVGARGWLDQGERLVTDLGGLEVRFNGKAAPVVFGSAFQTTVVAPFSIATAELVTIEVRYYGSAVSLPGVPVTSTRPALFTAAATGRGQAAALNEDATVNSEQNPARAGEIIVLYGTGGGLLDPAVQDGQVIEPPLPKLVHPVAVTIGGLSAEVLYAGPAPAQIPGVIQVNARIPVETAVGPAIPVAISAGGRQSPAGVTIALSP